MGIKTQQRLDKIEKELKEFGSFMRLHHTRKIHEYWKLCVFEKLNHLTIEELEDLNHELEENLNLKRKLRKEKLEKEGHVIPHKEAA